MTPEGGCNKIKKFFTPQKFFTPLFCTPKPNLSFLETSFFYCETFIFSIRIHQLFTIYKFYYFYNIKIVRGRATGRADFYLCAQRHID